MPNPIMVPVPAAVALIALIAAALYYTASHHACLPEPPQAKPTGGRHRPENIPEAQRRDWASIVAQRLWEQRGGRTGLISVLEIAGLPDREPVAPAPLHIPADLTEEADTRELVAVA